MAHSPESYSKFQDSKQVEKLAAHEIADVEDAVGGAGLQFLASVCPVGDLGSLIQNTGILSVFEVEGSDT